MAAKPSIPDVTTPPARSERPASVRPAKAAPESDESKSRRLFAAIDSSAERNAEVLLDLAKR